jgi:hypothetical protein
MSKINFPKDFYSTIVSFLLQSYCQKHSVNTKKDKSGNSGSEEDLEKKKMKAMTAEERNQARAEKYAI